MPVAGPRPRDRRVISGRPAATVRRLEPDATDLEEVLGAIGAGFAGTDDVTPSEPSSGACGGSMRDGLVVVVGAYDEDGAVGGGSHAPRGADHRARPGSRCSRAPAAAASAAAIT